MGRGKGLQQRPGQESKIKTTPERERERESEGRREGVEGLMCVYHSLSFFNETVVCFWRQLKLTEALTF